MLKDDIYQGEEEEGRKEEEKKRRREGEEKFKKKPRCGMYGTLYGFLVRKKCMEWYGIDV